MFLLIQGSPGMQKLIILRYQPTRYFSPNENEVRKKTTLQREEAKKATRDWCLIKTGLAYWFKGYKWGNSNNRGKSPRKKLNGDEEVKAILTVTEAM